MITGSNTRIRSAKLGSYWHHRWHETDRTIFNFKLNVYYDAIEVKIFPWFVCCFPGIWVYHKNLRMRSFTPRGNSSCHASNPEILFSVDTGIYMTSVMTLTAASLIVCVVVINLDSRGEKLLQAPKWLRNLLHTQPIRAFLHVNNMYESASKSAIVSCPFLSIVQFTYAIETLHVEHFPTWGQGHQRCTPLASP